MHRIVLLPLLSACASSWTQVDADGDSVTATEGDCWDNPDGPEGLGLGGADIHPGATETWYDGVDQDCAQDDDFDADADGWVPDAWLGATTLQVAGSGGLPGGDCWDNPSAIPAGYTVVPGSLADRDGEALAWTQPEAAQVHPDAGDAWYDGVDQDCAGDDDWDQDLDGFRTWSYPDATGAFGDDCLDGTPLDTANPAGEASEDVNPAATETWYDGTDADCSGGSDYDADGDTHDSDAYGGDDCDDTDDTVHPGQTDDETTPLADVDCDGYVDEDAIVFGSVVISELSKLSSAGGSDGLTRNPDANWFEVYNAESFDIDLSNWVFALCDETVTAEVPTWEECDATYEVAVAPDAGLVVEAGGYVVLCASDSAWTDPTRCDYVYTDTTTWTGTGPDGAGYADASATFEAEGGIIGASLEGTTVDDVIWSYVNEGQSWPSLLNATTCLLAASLDATLNDSRDGWDVTTADAVVAWATNPTDNWGTPGEANTQCP
jgi:hypothetical protein